MRRQTAINPGFRVAVASLCLSLALSPVTSAEVTADDPVVADIVRMLDAGLEPRLIRDWLDSDSKHPGPLSANDMIALAAANAPAELIEDLLQQSTRSGDAVAKTPAVPSDSDAAASILPSQGVGESNTGDCCLVDFSVEYRAPELDPEEGTDAPRGDLYLYIDGRFVGRFEPRGEIAGGGPQTFKRRVAPGRHTIRLTRELHLRSKNRKAGGARDHFTTVSPSSIRFEVQPGARWTMDIRWAQGVFSTKRPLHWRWSKDGQPVAGEEHAGVYQEDWSFLCEDVEISRDSGAIAEWRAADRSRDCVTWASLWPRGGAGSRAEILAEFERTGLWPGTNMSGRPD